MGIESDQLVYDYLSRVGDLAQQQQLPSGARMRLVSTLRGEIDRRRGTPGADSPAAVRRIIGRLGSPDELVAAAAESGDGTVALPPDRPAAGTGTSTGAGGAGERRTSPEGRRGFPRPRSGLLRRGPAGGEAEAPGPRAPKSGSWWGGSRGGTGTAGGSGAAGGGTETGAAHGGPEVPAAVPRPAAAPDDTPVRDWPDPSAPHLHAGGPQSSGEADWWRLEPGPFDAGTAVPGFVGGIEAPELLGRPPRPDAPAEDTTGADGAAAGPGTTGRPGAAGKAGAAGKPGTAGKAGTAGRPGAVGGPVAPGKPGTGRTDLTKAAPAGTGDGADAAGATAAPDGEGAAPSRNRRALPLRMLRRRKAAAPVVVAPVAVVPGPRRGFAHPLLLLAAALLVAGVVTGSWLPLAGGWLIAYSSRTLSRTEAKWAALGLPGLVAATGLVWVWGRMEGRWGEPIREGALRDVLLDAWPVVVRVAAIASALYLVWRARRRA